MCDSMVALAPETAARITLFAKNSDRKEKECQPLLQFPAAFHSAGSTVRCTHVEIPQVAETYRVLGHSPWWVWGFEHGVNEHAVAIGNHTVFSKEPVEGEPGLIGMDLVRLGLERGRSSREALEVIATLVETHGQGGSAFAPGAAGYFNSFLLADPREAWLLETSGRRWAARRTRLDSMSNHLGVGADWEIGSRDLESFARTSGWWAQPGRVDVAAAYRNPGVPARISHGRQSRSRALLEASRGRLDVASLAAALRDHLDGGPVRLPGTTPDDESFYTLCMHSEPVGTTTASLIAPLPDERTAPWPVWVSFATPCTGVFLPVYLDGVIPEALARGGEKPEADSTWWVMKRLQDAAAIDFPRTTPIVRGRWADLEARIEAERAVAEADARAAGARGDEDGALDCLTRFMSRTVEAAMERADSIARELA
jgi:dipeptidase